MHLINKANQLWMLQKDAGANILLALVKNENKKKI